MQLQNKTQLHKKLLTHIFLFLLSYVLCLLFASYLQNNQLSVSQKNWFPQTKDYLPTFLQNKLYPIPKVQDIPKKDYFVSGKNHEHLANFFRKLKQVEQEKRGIVRILHFGDSIIWGGFVTEHIENAFHKDFGNGGRGLVPVIDTLDRRLIKHKNYTSKSQVDWYPIKILGRENSKYGFLGESARPKFSRLNIRQILKDSPPWESFEIYYRNPDNIKLQRGNFSINGKDPIGNLSSKSLPCQKFQGKLENAEKAYIDLQHPELSRFYIDAVNLESKYGVAYSVVSRTGFEMNELRQIQEENLVCGLQLYQPDLIIFHFGVNESQHMRLYPKQRGPKIYQENFEKTLVRYRQNFPKSNLLVIGPAERVSHAANGKLDTMPEVLKVIQIQREISEKLKIAYYDTFLALGGSGQNLPMYKKDYLQGDRTHFTRKGGKYFTEFFYKDMYNSYQDYFGLQKKIVTRNEEKLARLKNSKAINFTSKTFFYFFLSVFFFAYLLSYLQLNFLRIVFLLLASYYFYSSWNPNLLFLIVFSTVVDYTLAIKIYEEKQKQKKATVYLLLSILTNLSLLFFFKYFLFFSELLHQVLINGSAIPMPPNNLVFPFLINGESVSLPLRDIILPVGISFYTFQTMSYTIDIWNGKAEAEYNFFKFSLYVTFFPQLVAGPIVRATEFLPKLRQGAEHFRLRIYCISQGLFLIFWGLSKKNAADWLAVNMVDRVYANPHMHTSLDIVSTFYAYGLQIYGDFSGYTDIALGVAMLLGFHLTKNFDRPYASLSIGEFWRRWHISLGSWFRNYLYIPLGGNRYLVSRNLLFTMLVCGIWHGAGIAFLLWGLYHGLLLLLERWFAYKPQQNTSRLLKYLQWFFSLHLVLLGWVIFRSDSLDTFQSFFTTLWQHSKVWNPDWVFISVVVIGYSLCVAPKEIFRQIQRFWHYLPAAVQGLFAAGLTLVMYRLSTSEVKAFIYFQF
ncbi:MAG: MBOAT family O-acyltransferase [Spirochaetota bacterium]